MFLHRLERMVPFWPMLVSDPSASRNSDSKRAPQLDASEGRKCIDVVVHLVRGNQRSMSSSPSYLPSHSFWPAWLEPVSRFGKEASVR